jgi:glycerophosphoryl diester phosphodiesterase
LIVPTKPPRLVGHRGWPARYPENTLEGFAAAVKAGADYLECDVQVSSDGVPFVCHDVSLKRTAGVDRNITETAARELDSISVGETTRFGERFIDVKLASLSALIAWLGTQPSVTLFVEVKRQSLRHHGTELVIGAIVNALQPALGRCAIISFDHACLAFAHQQGVRAIGWATEKSSSENRRIAVDLKPDYLFTNDAVFMDVHNALEGDWEWIVYETQDPQRALQLAAQGAAFVETNDIGAMLMSPELSAK